MSHMKNEGDGRSEIGKCPCGAPAGHDGDCRQPMVYIAEKELVALRSQRDRLREALKAIVDSGEIPYSESSPLIIAARTALAEGEST